MADDIRKLWLSDSIACETLSLSRKKSVPAFCNCSLFVVLARHRTPCLGTSHVASSLSSTSLSPQSHVPLYGSSKSSFLNMPTLISELTPLQNMWLYENQLTRGDSYEEKWHRFDPEFDTTIFRSKPQKRKLLPFEDDAAVKSRRSHSPEEHHRMRLPLKPATHGPRFPHMGEKLTWAQSRENLKVYYDHYGVRDGRLLCAAA